MLAHSVIHLSNLCGTKNCAIVTSTHVLCIKMTIIIHQLTPGSMVLHLLVQAGSIVNTFCTDTLEADICNFVSTECLFASLPRLVGSQIILPVQHV